MLSEPSASTNDRSDLLYEPPDRSPLCAADREPNCKCKHDEQLRFLRLDNAFLYVQEERDVHNKHTDLSHGRLLNDEKSFIPKSDGYILSQWTFIL